MQNQNCIQEWSVKTADTVMRKYPIIASRWMYEAGLTLKGIEEVWCNTKDLKYFSYIRDSMDYFIEETGNIKTYHAEEYNIDHVNNGKNILFLYKHTGDPKYKKAAMLLRKQLETHPRTKSGGFWHKKIYPNQIWLDGIYMGLPFYGEYAKLFEEPEIFDDIAKQVKTIAEKTYDPGSGLYYHAWDESREQQWANPGTGCSLHFWGRAMGWFAMALVDLLDFLPQAHPERKDILVILQSVIEGIASVQDRQSHVWYQILNMGQEKENYREASCSCMFVYSMAKAFLHGYIDERYNECIQKGYDGILREFASVDGQNNVIISSICEVAGLGGKAHRDGSFRYYMSEPVVQDDFKGVGAFILAANAVEKLIRRPPAAQDG